MIDIIVNDKSYQVDDDAATPLLWVIRDTLGLTGTKFGCGVGACGACTVLIEGEAVRSCLKLLGKVQGKITTIEGLGSNGLHPVQHAWISESVPQCGYCQSGMILATVALLTKNPNASDHDIDREITNICRCGTYSKIRRAIHKAQA